MKVRDNSVDVLRGISIIIMTYAHLLPFFAEESLVSLFERAICSLAAPIFLFLVGYNFRAQKLVKENIWRGGTMILLGSLIDVFIFSINPFTSNDVLYFIGISVWILTAFSTFTPRKIFITAVIFLVIGFSYQAFFDYRINIYEPKLGDSMVFGKMLVNLFFEGWFPLFPWLFFPFIGFWVKMSNYDFKGYHSLMLLVVLLSGICFFNEGHPQRDGSVELFYPVNFWYVLCTIGIVFLLFRFRNLFNYGFFFWLQELGKLSLFLYLFHLSIYHFTFFIFDFSRENRFLVFFFFVFFFIVLSFWVNYLKRLYPSYKNNFFLALIMGA